MIDDVQSIFSQGTNMNIEKYVDEHNRFHFNGYNFPELYAWSLGHAGARYDGQFCNQCYIDDMTKKCRHTIVPGNIIEHTKRGFMIIG